MSVKKHILLVEDNIIAAKFAKGLLEQLGCEVECADIKLLIFF
jgi:CheY-like chemotaxis protein